ncbi:MAG: lysogenization regulator HflD, partial [Gammaproteobacteria bacterium]|nr:lysogenization regulator HflD [Gammaproteobacteria bacterium]
MIRPIADRVLALAGIFQAANLVDDIAYKGSPVTAAVESSIRSIFAVNSEDVPSVYGGVDGLRFGLTSLRRILDEASTRGDMAVTQYVINLLALEKKARKKQKLMNAIRDRLEKSSEQIKHFDPTHDNVLANLADTYV